VDVRITPTSGYSGGMYTVDAVATIVTKQQVDKAVLLFRLLNGTGCNIMPVLIRNLLE